MQTEYEGNLFYEYAFTLRDLENIQDSIAFLEQALKIWKRIYGGKNGYLTACMNDLSQCQDVLSEHKKAINYYKKELRIDKDIYGYKDNRITVRLNNLGKAWKALGEPKKAIGY